MVHLALNPMSRLPCRKLTVDLVFIQFGLAPGWVIVVYGDGGGGRRVFPGEAGETITPENAGMDPERLDAFVDIVQGSEFITGQDQLYPAKANALVFAFS